MATNAATLSLSSSLLDSSKRFVSFSTVPYPYPSLSHFVLSHTSKPRVSTPFALAAVVNGQTAIVDGEEKRRKLGNPTQVYVCNLPRSCDTQQLIPIFTPHGTVLSAEVCRNAETGASKGSAYVTMGSYNAAKNAIDALDGLVGYCQISSMCFLNAFFGLMKFPYGMTSLFHFAMVSLLCLGLFK